MGAFSLVIPRGISLREPKHFRPEPRAGRKSARPGLKNR
jgi:hypothetical protein